jgi:hypothetical protein
MESKSIPSGRHARMAGQCIYIEAAHPVHARCAERERARLQKETASWRWSAMCSSAARPLGQGRDGAVAVVALIAAQRRATRRRTGPGRPAHEEVPGNYPAGKGRWQDPINN